MAVSINFERVWRYMSGNPELFGLLSLIRVLVLSLVIEPDRDGHREVVIQGKSYCWFEPAEYSAQAA